MGSCEQSAMIENCSRKSPSLLVPDEEEELVGDSGSEGWKEGIQEPVLSSDIGLQAPRDCGSKARNDDCKGSVANLENNDLKGQQQRFHKVSGDECGDDMTYFNEVRSKCESKPVLKEPEVLPLNNAGFSGADSLSNSSGDGSILSEVHQVSVSTRGSVLESEPDDTTGVLDPSVEICVKAEMEICSCATELPNGLCNQLSSLVSTDRPEKKDAEAVDDLNGHEVLEIVEQKYNALNCSEFDKCDRNLSVQESAGNLREGSSIMAPECVLVKPAHPSVMFKLCSTTSTLVDDGPSGSLVVGDVLRGHSSVEPVNATSVAEISGSSDRAQRENGGTGNDCEVKCLDIPSSSTRSSCTRKSIQKVHRGKSGRKCGKKVIHISRPAGTIDLLPSATRKRRSCLSRSACSSAWGLLGNLSKHFEGSNGFALSEDLNQGSGKKKGGRRSRKQSREKVAIHSEVTNQKHASSGRIRLKVIMGRKKEQANVDVIPPAGVEPITSGSDPNHTDLSRTDDLVVAERSSGKSTEKHRGNSLQFKYEKLASSNDDGYLDPGTSPDSEIINQVPDSHLRARVSEVLHNSVNNHTKDSAVPATADRRVSSKFSRKKRNKNNELKLDLEDSLVGRSSTDNAKMSEACGEWQKMGNGCCSVDAGISAPSENVSCYTSGSEHISVELLAVADDGSPKALRTEHCVESDVHSGGHGVLAPSESGSQKKLSLLAKSHGSRASKSSKSKGNTTNKPKLNDATRSKPEKPQRRKTNKRNQTSKQKVVDGIVVESQEMKNRPETGMHAADEIGLINAGSGVTFNNPFTAAIVPSGAMGRTLPPRIAWVCCDDCQKWRCIPAELADIIEETNCKWTCKDNQDEAFADCSIPQEKSNSEINAELQLSDDEDARFGSKGYGRRHAAGPQQSSWMLIMSNQFLHRSRKTQTMDEIMVCQCKVPQDGSLGCGDGCLNRMLNIECVQGTCPCEDRCSNQQFQRQQYANLKWFRCGKKGYGLQVLEDISEGDFLIEYVGEVLDLQAYEARQREYASRGHKHFYFMTLNGNEVIDACDKGNLGRFVNHSCDPNCQTEKWMVNGEICVGLFAKRNIKKGEELTFDYNYVRVFGAAAKKCYCGSPLCRGYIGADSLNAEVIVHGDSDEEFPEPVMLSEHGEVDDRLEGVMAASSYHDSVELHNVDDVYERKIDISPQNRETFNKTDNPAFGVGGPLLSAVERDMIGKALVDLSLVQGSSDKDEPLQIENMTNAAISAAQQQTHTAERAISTAPKPSPRLDTLSVSRMLSKPLSDSIDDCGKMLEVEMAENDDCGKLGVEKVLGEKIPSQWRPCMKIAHSRKAVKNQKINDNSMRSDKDLMTSHKSRFVSQKPKKLLEVSANGRLETVEEKLNELLDADGGICKRKDASKGYLKLLLLTAASGDIGNGGAIESNRDLSMILDAILKTKSRGVLHDIINKNGLQMLHNMMKLYRWDFKKIPILRKLLKVFEFLAEKEILAAECINADPPCAGVESFRESMLTLTEHEDKKVHQIARNFRDRWIPRPIKKFNGIEKCDRKVEFGRGLNLNRCFTSHPRWREQEARPSEAIDCVKQTVLLSNPVDPKIQDGVSLQTNEPTVTRTRKRKSRWDQPADPVSHGPSKEPKIELSSSQKLESCPEALTAKVGISVMNGVNEGEICSNGAQNLSEQRERDDDLMQDAEDDAPPGFSSPIGGACVHPQKPLAEDISPLEEDAPPGFSIECPSEMSLGNLQERFNSWLPVAYGVPVSVMQRLGTPEAGAVDSWVIAPGLPFQPFPPLPPYAHGPPCSGAANVVITNPTVEEVQQDTCLRTASQMDQGVPSTSSASLPDAKTRGATPQAILEPEGSLSYGPGRRYFRQQRWSNPKPRPPWLWRRNGWGFKGHRPIKGQFNVNMGPVPEEISRQPQMDVNFGVDYAGNSC